MLALRECSMTVAVLFGVLKQTPNLEWLDLEDVALTGSCKPDFRMEKLESFNMDNPGDIDVPLTFLDDLGEVFTGLKLFRLLRNVITSDEVYGSVIKIVEAQQNTLESLELCNGNFLEALCRMEKLRLKWLSCFIDFKSDSHWDIFCRKQQQLEKLLIMAKDYSTICDVAQKLPNLKKLPLDIMSGSITKADFLNEMPNLEKIDINGHLNGLDFRSAASPKLTLFHMVNATAKKLVQYLQKSPNLSVLNIHECVLIGDSEHPARFQYLKELVLSKCKLPPNVLMALCCQNPQLEQLQLRFLSTLTDEMFLKICKELPRLRFLALVSCALLTDAVGDYIIQHCVSLEKLKISGFTLSEEALAKLRERHVRMKRWFWPYPFDPVGGFAQAEH